MLKFLFACFLITLGVGAVYTLYLDTTVRRQFEGKRWALPARVYAQPAELYVGQRVDVRGLVQTLRQLGYRKAAKLQQPGTYFSKAGELRLHTRPFTFWDGAEEAKRVRVRFRGNELSTMRDMDSGAAQPLLRLEPLEIGSFYPAHNEDRVLVRLQDVPESLIKALLAVEDHRFYEHHGVSPKAIARAVWANIRAGATVQGGSTITQQLVKNFFLTHERTLWRKANEAIMALLLEWHYEKDEILEAYLNEVYLGQDGERAIHGFGLASHFYFAQPAEALNLSQSALLVALVRGASYYNPRRHPERATKRRNHVLDVMRDRGVISDATHGKAVAIPLEVTRRPPGGTTRFPAFLDLVRRQLRRDYRDEDLTSEGLRIFTTMNPDVQEAAESALGDTLSGLERGRGMRADTLEGAAVVTATGSGEVLAVVGGRDAGFAGFNRALDAVRPIGSLVKPAVYLTALSRPNLFNLLTPLDDSPLSLESPGAEAWSPQNFDKQFRGSVPLHSALANSYNVPTVRLGIEVGVRDVLETLRGLGVSRPLKPYPAMLLGSAELSPLEVTQMYQTLAGGGFRTPLRAIREVTDAERQPLQRYPLRVEQAFPGGPVYLVNTVLQEAAREGTGRSMYRSLSPELAAAGKTGTTDELRDSWFAGFTGDRLAVVWVGRDDNRPAGLTGATGALKVWTDVMRRIDPVALYLAPPADVEVVAIDPDSGLLADGGCEGAMQLPFIQGSAPAEHAPCAGGGLRDTLDRFVDWIKGE